MKYFVFQLGNISLTYFTGQTHNHMWTLWLWLDHHQLGHQFVQGLALVSSDPARRHVFPGSNFLTTINSDPNELRVASKDRLGQGTGLEERDRQLVELNVLAEVHWIMQQLSVMKAARKRGMGVHGSVYDSVQRSCVKLEISPSVDSK